MSVFLKLSLIFRKKQNSFLNWVFSFNGNSEIYPQAKGVYLRLTLAPTGNRSYKLLFKT